MDTLEQLEAVGSSALLRYSEPSPEFIAEIEKLNKLSNQICCGIYAPEDDTPVPVPPGE